MRDQATRLQRYLRVAYEGAEGGVGAGDAVPEAAPRRIPTRWAARTGAAVRVAAVLLVLAVAGVTFLVMSRTEAAPVAPSAQPSPPVVATADPGPVGETPTPLPAVVVHVAGEVVEPGLIELAAGARVADAIDAAGGATDAADLDALNLAASLIDGQQVYVPAEGEVPPIVTGPADPGSGSTGGPVDVNTADATTLETLPGIGPALAGRIIDWRTEHGPFPSVEALTDVPGIGPATLDRLRDLVTV